MFKKVLLMSTYRKEPNLRLGSFSMITAFAVIERT